MVKIIFHQMKPRPFKICTSQKNIIRKALVVIVIFVVVIIVVTIVIIAIAIVIVIAVLIIMAVTVVVIFVIMAVIIVVAAWVEYTQNILKEISFSSLEHRSAPDSSDKTILQIASNWTN